MIDRVSRSEHCPITSVFLRPTPFNERPIDVPMGPRPTIAILSNLCLSDWTLALRPRLYFRFEFCTNSMSTEDHTRPVIFKISSRVNPSGFPISVWKIFICSKAMSKIKIPKSGIAPYLSKLETGWASLVGRKPTTTLNPSKGGMGSKLNTPKSMFTFIRM